jgi:hypothetical protein
MSSLTFSAFTSDLTRNPGLYESMRRRAERHGTVDVAKSEDGKVTTFTAVAA